MTTERAFGEVLEAAVAAFEKRFTIVDDHYMHVGGDATAEGVEFRLNSAGSVTAKSSDVHVKSIFMWKSNLPNVEADGHDYLAWRVRPHFEANVDGIVLTSRSATGLLADLSTETKARLGLLTAAPEEAE